jgi:hypothetical protein
MDDIPSSCQDLRDLPDMTMLRDRIKFFSNIHGVDPQITDEVVDFLGQGLEVPN